MGSRDRNTLDPGSDIIPLGANIGQDAPHRHRAEHDHDGQHHHKLRDFRCFPIR